MGQTTSTRLDRAPVEVPVRQEPVAATALANEVEAWLQVQPHTQPKQDLPVRWEPGGGGRAARVDGFDHLTALVGALALPGDFGVIMRGEIWAQTMRVNDGWIVEVCGVPGPDCNARRVRAAGAADHPTGDRLLAWGADETVRAGYRPGEAIASVTGVAHVLWAWVHGRLLDGLELRDIDDGD